ncbi:MAG: Fur family transcriptional regulator [Spirosomataceae bacterium]
MRTAVRNTLKEFDLRHTSCREDILLVFNEQNNALSHNDLETVLGERFDRVTIYRTLKTFVEKGLIHKILDDEGGTRYALCKSSCSHEHHHHDHVHFKCRDCGQTTCIDSVQVPVFHLPAGYEKEETNVLVQGRCPQCSVETPTK